MGPQIYSYTGPMCIYFLARGTDHPRKLINSNTDMAVFIHLVVSLTKGPKPLPKRALHLVRSRASSFK